MRSLLLYFASALVVMAAASCSGPAKEAAVKVSDSSLPDVPAPVAKQIPKVLKKHGDLRTDSYFWLQERENPEVKAYLDAENDYTRAAMKSEQKIQATLLEELKGRIKQDDSTVPQKRGGFYYYTRFESGKEFPIHCRKRIENGAQEEILLDSNQLAHGQSYFQVTGFQVSPDETILAYSVDTVGRRVSTIYFKDLTSGNLLEDKIPEVTGNMAWASDNKTLFYTKQNPKTLRSEWVYRHQLGQKKPRLVFHEKDPAFGLYVNRSLAENFIFITASSTLTTEQWYLDASRPDKSFQVFERRRRGHEYKAVDGGDRFFVLTNDKAKNFRVMEAPLGKTARKNWKPVVPHRPDVLITDLTVFLNHLVLDERHKGLTRILVLNRHDKSERIVPFQEEVYLASVGRQLEYDAEWLRIDYESMTTPESVYEYNLSTGVLELRKRQEVLGGFKPENYESKRLFACGHDGVPIPVSLVYRKSFAHGPRRPLLIHGYGAYGWSMEPYFSGSIVSLLDRGFVHAIAHVRGGSEMGRAWYEDGRQQKKMNTFRDFIAVTEFLHSRGFSSPAHTYASGGSAGGLLMGVVMNMRPDLYNGIVADVPFVDVLTTMLDKDIPLTTGEFDEWGNPAKKADYDYMKSYSPYDNVGVESLPSLLVTTGFHDSQVQYWEPAKWVAKIRKNKTEDSGLVLLHTEMSAGHGGKSGRFARLEQVALEYAFLLKLEKMPKGTRKTSVPPSDQSARCQI
jgi:oligopeptidase B